jgi:hypothetical protein
MIAVAAGMRVRAATKPVDFRRGAMVSLSWCVNLLERPVGHGDPDDHDQRLDKNNVDEERDEQQFMLRDASQRKALRCSSA